ncbi:MAG: lysophospholipid acyltransferase family protein [Candidatus Lindowbacteria bacterium]|nr:lysophospholipid acyltransferase family protein [Candidatus Lindowbacteria bacterium]
MEYALMRATVFLLALPPRALNERLGRGLGSFIYSLGIRRKIVAKNLSIAFPGKSDAERADIAKKSYQNLGVTLVEFSSMPNWSDRELKERAAFENVETFKQYYEKGKGVIIATGHLGPLDVAPARLQVEGFQVTTVYRTVRNPHVEDFINRIRTLRGAKVAASGIGIRDAIKALKNGECIVILGDQDAGKNGIFAPFFGKPASTLPGPAELAIRTGALLMLGTAVRDGDRVKLIAGEPIPVTTVDETTAEYNKRLEEVIRRWPEQYFWLHNRWKTEP